MCFFMWIETTKNGKYLYRSRIKDFNGNKKKISITLTKKNDKLASEILTKMKLKEQSYIDITASFFDALEIFLEKEKDSFKISTYKLYESRINKTKRTQLDTPLLNVNSSYLDTLINKIATTNNSYNIYLKFFKRVLKKMYKLDYIDDITWLNKLDYKEHKINYDGKYFEKDEIEKILKEIEANSYYHDMINFMINSGLRIGEVLALTEDDILDNNTLRINKTIDQFKNISSPKTYESNRVISLNNKCTSILNNRIYINKVKSELDSKYINKGILFPKQNGDYNSYSAVSKWTRDNIKSVKFTFHKTRHTHASLCMDAGIPLELISARLGHKGTEITRAVYIHKTKKAKQKELEVFKNLEF